MMTSKPPSLRTPTVFGTIIWPIETARVHVSYAPKPGSGVMHGWMPPRRFFGGLEGLGAAGAAPDAGVALFAAGSAWASEGLAAVSEVAAGVVAGALWAVTAGLGPGAGSSATA